MSTSKPAQQTVPEPTPRGRETSGLPTNPAVQGLPLVTHFKVYSSGGEPSVTESLQVALKVVVRIEEVTGTHGALGDTPAPGAVVSNVHFQS